MEIASAAKKIIENFFVASKDGKSIGKEGH